MIKYRKAIAAFVTGVLGFCAEVGIDLTEAQTNTLRAAETILVTALVFLFPNEA